MVFSLVLGFALATIALSITSIFRSFAVREYRLNLIDSIHDTNMRELEHRPPYPEHRWRWVEFEAVSSNRMVVQFWRPLDSFYPKSPSREGPS